MENKTISEEQFYKIIERSTGKKIEEGDYGFIAGTRLPYKHTIGMVSSTLKEGFIVWKKEPDGSYTDININIVQTTEQNIKDIVCFLIMEPMDAHVIFSNSISKYGE